jgi:hypothetical protein
MKKLLVLTMSVSSCVAFANAEIIEEFVLDSNRTITVNEGQVIRIEKLTGTANAILTKDGVGRLEIASVKNVNATIHILSGEMKSVRPKFPSIEGDIFFHADAANSMGYDLVAENGTNFVERIKNTNPQMPYVSATRISSRPNPFLKSDGLNGLPVFDFGTFYSPDYKLGHGAAMELNEKCLTGELLYVWQDYEGVENIPTNGTRHILGPNPINLRYSYRGLGGGGVGYPMYYTAAAFISENLHVDGVRRSNEYMTYVPGPGWHLVNIHSTRSAQSKVTDYGFYGFGFSPSGVSGGTGYGGFRLAEVVACTNELSGTDREKIIEYLNDKWFRVQSFKLLNVSSGAVIDTTASPLKVESFVASEDALVVGDNISFSDSYSSLNFKSVSGVVEVKKREESLNRNLSFAGDACVSIASGTAVVDRIRSATGILNKTGQGVLELAFPDEEIRSISVSEGTLEIAPLKTTGAYLHVDATSEDSMTVEEVEGKRLVVQWRDINNNGRYLKQSSEKHAYGTKSVKNYPYLTANFTNGLSVVDFGTFNNICNQEGWGAELDIYPMIRGANSQTNPLVYNVFAVWGDREDAKDANLYNGQEIRGPTLFGNGGAWYRGWGGGGNEFKIRAAGSSTMGNDNRVNGASIGYVTWMNSYIPPARLWLQNTYVKEGVGVQQVGGNASLNIYEIPSGRGVAGGLRIGELMLFRYQMPANERSRIDNALRAKWFNDSNPINYDSILMGQSTHLLMPYADLSVTNLTIAGSMLARAITVEKALRVTERSDVSASMKIKSGGTFTIARNDAGDFFELEADAFSIESKGLIEISDWDGLLCGQSYRVIESESLSGDASGWSGRNADGTVKARFEMRSDGLYLKFESCGTRIIIR